MPGVVLGPPVGGGEHAGGLDVVSLGKNGTIELRFDGVIIVDGPGPDFIVFENAFSGWRETGHVAARAEVAGARPLAPWKEWPCDPKDAAGGFPGCAGVNPVLSSPDNGIDPTDPAVAGGDAFDLADLGIARSRRIRIRDSGLNEYEGNTGGFDLDAIVVVNGEPLK